MPAKETKRKFRLLILFLCIFYFTESDTPFVTRGWPRWKRALFFNRFSDWFIGLLMDRVSYLLLK